MQSLLLRPWFMVLIMLSGPVLVMGVSPTWAKGMLMDAWEVTSFQKTISELENERLEMNAIGDHVFNRIQVKESMLDQLEVGKTNLRATAKKFWEMDRERPMIVANHYSRGRNVEDVEAAALMVLRYMRSRVEGGSALRADSFGRLESEFTAEFGHRPPQYY
ncbi:MAG: hypothetical protein U0798_16240 [Gemmataceae bacterium]